MQNNLQSQNNPSKLFDFCEQCKYFHQVIFNQGVFLMKACQNSIRQTFDEQKVSMEAKSTNSGSAVSLRNYLITFNQLDTKGICNKISKKSQYNPASQEYALRRKVEQISIRQPSNQSQLLPYYSIVQLKPLPAFNQFKKSQTSFTFLLPNPQTKAAKDSRTFQSRASPAVPFLTKQKFRETPQFTPLYTALKNKQICRSRKYFLKNNHELTKKSQAQMPTEQSSYFCCGYIKKFKK